MKIAFKNAGMTSGFRELGGHGCSTTKEMEAYCRALDPEGKSLKVVPDDFDFGQVVEAPMQELWKSKPIMGKVNPEAVREILAALKKHSEKCLLS